MSDEKKSFEAEPIEILIVDDSEDDVLLTKEAFSESRMVNVVNDVSDGEEALAYLRREGRFSEAREPGLILLDINMPKKNGLEALEEIKGDPALRHIPVVMLTTSDRDEDIVSSYSLGACSYVRKPVSFDELKRVTSEFALYWTMVSVLPKARR